jgi:FdhD protein
MENPIRKYGILKLWRGSLQYVEDEVAVELPVTIHVNGKPLAVLYATPRELRELAVGHLVTEGLVKNLEEIVEIRVEGSNVYVTALNVVEERSTLRDIKATKVVKTVCGQPSEIPSSETYDWKVNSNVKWSSTEIFKVARKLNSNATIYRKTGGVHAAIIIDCKGAEFLCEDVGRHNAVDKVVGAYVLKRSVDFSSTFLACSGRLSSEMVLKAARVGIPIIASISAPTSLGISLADRFRITLIGFVRGAKFNVYTHPERLT